MQAALMTHVELILACQARVVVVVVVVVVVLLQPHNKKTKPTSNHVMPPSPRRPDCNREILSFASLHLSTGCTRITNT